jgi:hypothetical protein
MTKLKYTTATSAKPQLVDFCQEILAIDNLLADGLRHGHFEYSISCKIGTGGRREITVAGGLSHKITIPEDELPR